MGPGHKQGAKTHQKKKRRKDQNPESTSSGMQRPDSTRARGRRESTSIGKLCHFNRTTIEPPPTHTPLPNRRSTAKAACPCPTNACPRRAPPHPAPRRHRVRFSSSWCCSQRQCRGSRASSVRCGRLVGADDLDCHLGASGGAPPLAPSRARMRSSTDVAPALEDAPRRRRRRRR